MKLNKKGLAPIAIIIIVAVLSAGAAGGGIWYYQDQQVQKQKTSISTLETDKKNLETEKTNLEQEKQKVEEQIKTLAGSNQTVTVQNNEVDQINKVCVVGKDEELGLLVYVENSNGKFADCGIGQKNGPGGFHLFLKKINNVWTKIWSGNGDPTEQDIEKYKIPRQIYPDSKY